MAWLMFRNLTGPDGECAAIIHYEEERATAYRHRWATFVQVYDPDRIDTPAEQVGNPNVREGQIRSEEHKSELQSLMRISYAVFCLKKKTTQQDIQRLVTTPDKKTAHSTRTN